MNGNGPGLIGSDLIDLSWQHTYEHRSDAYHKSDLAFQDENGKIMRGRPNDGKLSYKALKI